MTPLDDLRPGMWVALVTCKKDQQLTFPGVRRSLWVEPEDIQFDGFPWKIISISLPFLCVEGRGRRTAIDVRDWEVKKLTRQYAKAMLGVEHRSGTASAELPTGHCPRCGTKLIQRRIGEGQWIPVCPECDQSRPPAKKGIVIQ